MSRAVIQEITFSEELVQITYIEEYDQSEYVAIMKTLLVDSTKVKEELGEAIEACQDLLDAALLIKRNPPKKKRRRDEEEDDDDDE